MRIGLKSFKSRRGMAGLISSLACICLICFASKFRNQTSSSDVLVQYVDDAQSLVFDAPQLDPTASPMSPRMVYPYSVVDGGIHQTDELKKAVQRDSVVARHYADFDVKKARFVTNETAKLVYVSYRVKDRVFWTKKKVKLAKGETLITDGKNYARTRCANRISESTQAITSPDEPSTASFDTPISDTPDPVLVALNGELSQRPLFSDSVGSGSEGSGENGKAGGNGTPQNTFGPGGTGGYGGFSGGGFGGGSVGSGGSGGPSGKGGSSIGNGGSTGGQGGNQGTTSSGSSGTGSNPPITNENGGNIGSHPGGSSGGEGSTSPGHSGSGGNGAPTSVGGGSTPPGDGSSVPPEEILTPLLDDKRVDLTQPPAGSPSTASTEAVPEPGTFLLLSTGLIAYSILRKARKK